MSSPGTEKESAASPPVIRVETEKEGVRGQGARIMATIQDDDERLLTRIGYRQV